MPYRVEHRRFVPYRSGCCPIALNRVKYRPFLVIGCNVQAWRGQKLVSFLRESRLPTCMSESDLSHHLAPSACHPTWPYGPRKLVGLAEHSRRLFVCFSSFSCLLFYCVSECTYESITSEREERERERERESVCVCVWQAIVQTLLPCVRHIYSIHSILRALFEGCYSLPFSTLYREVHKPE